LSYCLRYYMEMLYGGFRVFLLYTHIIVPDYVEMVMFMRMISVD